MLSRSRLYTRSLPDKDARLFLLFCEGSVTEPNYFKYFNELNSRIRIVPIPADDQENNSPVGLYETAKKMIIKTTINPNPEYEIMDDDEVWFVIDTDQWKDKIDKLRENVIDHNWNIAQSNPCFEVWLYYHFHSEKPNFDGHTTSMPWKGKLSEFIPGGFNSNKYPIYIQRAINNSKNNHTSIEVASNTEVHILAERFFPLISNEINRAIETMT